MTGKMLEFVIQGGVVMIPILICSAIACFIIIERLFMLRRGRVLRADVLDAIEQLLRQQKIPEASTLCTRHEMPMTRMVQVALLNAERPKMELIEMVESQGRLEMSCLERYLTTLSTIASIAPFLGLLGTVMGLLRVFQAISEEGGVNNAALLSGGIYNALITTVGGLCVAIPTLVAYNYFSRRAESLMLDIERISLRLLNILKR